MHSMATDRRTFLTLAAGLLLAPGPSARAVARPAPAAPRLLSCRRDGRGRDLLSAVDGQGRIAFDVPLPERGHGLAVHPRGGECTVFARRPGRFLYVVDLPSGRVLHRIQAPQGRHYYGHGVYTPDGDRLYVTENAFETGEGVIGVYDPGDAYRRLGELPSHGTGPHELRLLGDGRTLAVANGGIRTHPDLPRAKLNLDTMQPSLAYVDAEDGRLLGAYGPPRDLHQLSMRHLDVAPDGTVCVAMQWQGPADRYPPLVALHRGEDELRLLQAPQPVQRRLRNYCGSVRFDASGRVAAVTAPRGGLATAWSIPDGQLMGTLDLPDTCGLAPTREPGTFTLSSGNGALLTHRFPAGTSQPLRPPGEEHWDNHLAALSRPRGPSRSSGPQGSEDGNRKG
jgi:hypothetical protein